MTVDDRTRLNLHRRLEAVLGPEEADTLMAHLPPVTWSEVATTANLSAVEATLRNEIHTVEATLRNEIHTVEATLRNEIHTVEAALRSEIQTLDSHVRGLETTVRSDIRGLGSELRVEMADGFTQQTRWMVTFICGWSAVVMAAARLLF